VRKEENKTGGDRKREKKEPTTGGGKEGHGFVTPLWARSRITPGVNRMEACQGVPAGARERRKEKIEHLGGA